MTSPYRCALEEIEMTSPATASIRFIKALYKKKKQKTVKEGLAIIVLKGENTSLSPRRGTPGTRVCHVGSVSE